MTGPRASRGASRLPPRLRLLAWVVVVMVALAVLAFIAVGADSPPDPRLESAAARVPGFSSVAFAIRPGEGRAPAVSGRRCALLAETEDQLRRGLMGRRDLAGYDAMIFRFPSDSTRAFYMRNVPVPLSVAWFDADGRFVSSADMAPCGDEEGCPLYAASKPYRFALEVLGGGLERLGIGPGSVLSVGGDCVPR